MRNDGVSGSHMSETRSTTGGTAIDSDNACADKTPPAAYANKIPQLKRYKQSGSIEAPVIHIVLVDSM